MNKKFFTIEKSYIIYMYCTIQYNTYLGEKKDYI